LFVRFTVVQDLAESVAGLKVKFWVVTAAVPPLFLSHDTVADEVAGAELAGGAVVAVPPVVAAALVAAGADDVVVTPP
jgi:hypothetical protein